MSAFFGSDKVQLLRGRSLVPVANAEEALAGKKYVLVYFSAHWCPPCRVFTPQLKRFYEVHGPAKNFEVIFVSGDKSADAMSAYMETAHGDWLAMSFDCAKTVGRSWAERYGVQTIPAVLVFENATDEKGERKLITSVGKDMVVHDEEAERFPWVDGEVELKAYNRGLLRNIIISVIIALVLSYYLKDLKI